MDARSEVRLVEEHRAELGILRELRVHALHGDGARKPERAFLPPEIDRSHPACRELAEQLVTFDRRHCPTILAHRKPLRREGKIPSAMGVHTRANMTSFGKGLATIVAIVALAAVNLLPGLLP